MPSAQLCSTCSSITLHALQKSDGCSHLPDARLLPASAQVCTLCRLLLREMLQRPDTTHVNPPAPYANLAAVLDESGILSDDHVEIRLAWNEGLLDFYLVVRRDSEPEEVRLQIGRHSLRMFRAATGNKASQPHRIDLIPYGSVISTIPDLDYIASLTHQWLDECVDAHHHCKSAISDLARPLPTRLLDVGAISSSKIHLCHTAGEVGQYVALSYCWGGSTQLQTTNVTLSSHINGVLVQDLPPTCRDAVLVTRSLGLQYLWIDALCIVQDDAADWAREAAMMGSVYGNAHITLAASRATTSMAGFLGPRTEDVVATLSPSDTESFNVALRHSFAQDTDRSPLARRAWVIQERVLSRRTLHFTTTQIYWECWTRQQGENLDNLYPGVLKNETYPDSLAPCAADPDILCQSKLPTPRQWWYLLASYTSCALTYPRDKLVAISGLIDLMCRRTGQHAISGVFQDSLHPGLLWSACDVPLERQSDVKFPSWSWASRIGRINHLQLYDWARNDDLRLLPGVDDRDARLCSTMRRLKLDVTYGPLERSDDYRDFPPELDYHVVRFRFVSPDWISDDDEQGLGWLVLDADDGNEGSDPEWNRFGWVVVACAIDLSDEDEEDGPNVKIEGVSTEQLRTVSADKEGPFYCLIVHEVRAGMYERVGVGAIKSFTWFDDSKEEIVIV